MSVLVLVAWAFVVVLIAASLHRAVFALAYLVGGRRRDEAAPPARQRRFAVVIPAHDEEHFIEGVIASIRAAQYPQDRIAIHVVADNCTDRTAAVVRALGEPVAERIEPERRGKGQALDWMFRRLDLSGVDAVAVFDADNVIEPGFFAAMNRELERGRRCLQGYNGISNPGESVMTRLLTVTYVMKNLLFNGGKAVLGLSVILNGTGMVFVRDVIERIGWRAMTIGEDLEQTFTLLEHGERVDFVTDARSGAQESTTLREGYTQRQRWTTGRRALYGTARRAVVGGLREGSFQRVQCGIDLLMPTYAKLMNWSVVGLGVALLLRPWSPSLLWGVGGVLGYQALEVGIALVLMRAKPRFVLSLVFAPVFLVWRAGIEMLALFGHRRSEWSRASRTRRSDADTD